MFITDIVDTNLVWLFVTSILLACFGDIETNPGPDTLTPNQGRHATFSHVNMRRIKKGPDELDHIRADVRGVYDVITSLSADDNLDQYDRPLYNVEGYHDPVRRDGGGRRGGGVLPWVSENPVLQRRLDLEMADAEMISLEIRCSSNQVIPFLAYRTNE